MGTEAEKDYPVSYAGWDLGGPGLKPKSLWRANLYSENTPARCSEVLCDGFMAPRMVTYKACCQGWDVNQERDKEGARQDVISDRLP